MTEARYTISVTAELLGVHPQTLRLYERRGLIRPKRSKGNTRLYSEEDIRRIRQIQHLSQDLGINLAGIEMLVPLLDRLAKLEREVAWLRDQLSRTVRVHTTPPPPTLFMLPPSHRIKP